VGAKAGILALHDGDIAAALRRQPRPEAARTAALVAGVYPGYDMEPVDGWPLAESTYPDEDIVYALSALGVDILCDQRFMLAEPSELPGHVLDLAGGRRVTLCQLDSVDDSFAYAVWVNGALARSLSVGLSLPGKIVENIGEPLDFERSFWAMRAASGRPPGTLGFHPLDLGRQAMRFLFGFALEGEPEPDDVDAAQVAMLGFRVTDPSGDEQAARQAALSEFVQRAGPSRRHVLGPAGSLVAVNAERGPA
jgi:hypothetical protein